MRRYDLQVHTDVSPCSRNSPRDVVDAALDAGLDGIAITDHDTLDGYEAVAALAPDDLAVIPGVEVTTTQGHLLALNVSEVPPMADPLAVIDRVHDQGGLAILSHPFDSLREHYTADLEAIAKRVDGVEATNSRCVLPRFNRRARSFAESHGLAITGGSDAHFPMEVGRACTISDRPVLEAIRARATRTDGRGGYVSGHVATKLSDALSLLDV
ncbi:PHP domain-containing protein [Halosolutus gelatinilyticus]|uniref:PHP domain-containing protein n=1 Tax=Halosolutus gelatinilyticus TaxID=2931975 RepID=UPI001FF4A4C2|nr:PHP domain-containing protein [Halosolutus gelatinilyticus]